MSGAVQRRRAGSAHGVMVMVVVAACSRSLRLRRDRNREAEDEEESGQELFHIMFDENSRSRDYEDA